MMNIMTEAKVEVVTAATMCSVSRVMAFKASCLPSNNFPRGV